MNCLLLKKDVTNICNQFKCLLKHKLDNNNIYYFHIPDDKLKITKLIDRKAK